MNSKKQFDEALESVHHAEEAVYHAQASPDSGDFQQADQTVKLAKEKVNELRQQISTADSDTQHRLHQAEEHLKHLEEAEQALLDR